MCVISLLIMVTAGEGSNCTANLHAETYRQNITSPGYPDAYSNNIQCTWMIEACEYCVIVLVLSTVHIQDSPQCVHDRLVLYDGPEIYDTIIVTVCGSQTGTFESSGNSMSLSLYTDAAGNGRGYAGYYSAKDNEVVTIAGIIAGVVLGLACIILVAICIAYRVKTRKAWFCEGNQHSDTNTYRCGSRDNTTRHNVTDPDNFIVCFCKGLSCKSASKVLPSSDDDIKPGTSSNYRSHNSNDVPKLIEKDTNNPRETVETVIHANENDNQLTDRYNSGLPPRRKIRSVKRKRAPGPPVRPVSQPTQTSNKPPETSAPIHKPPETSTPINKPPETSNQTPVTRIKLDDNGNEHPIHDNNYVSKSVEETSELEMELVRQWSLQLSGNGDATPVKQPAKTATSVSTKLASASGNRRSDLSPHSKKTPKRKTKSGMKNLKSKLNKKKKEKISIVLYLDGGSKPTDIITEHVQFEDTTTGVNLNEYFQAPTKPITGPKSKVRERKKEAQANQTPIDRGQTYVESLSTDDVVATEADMNSDDAGVYLYRVSEVTETSETIFMYNDELPNTVPAVE